MTFLMLLHVVTGALAVVFGAFAFVMRKGKYLHIRFGRGFVATMTVSSLLGAVLGLVKAEEFFITFFAGALSVYLVLSGWFAARDRRKQLSRATTGLAWLNVAIFAALISLGSTALSSPDGTLLGFHAEDYFFLSGMSAIGLISDASLIFRGVLTHKFRVARHLWRMALGFFIAAGSAFTGPGANAFPEAVRESGLLMLPELLILATMMVYLGLTIFRPQRRPA